MTVVSSPVFQPPVSQKQRSFSPVSAALFEKGIIAYPLIRRTPTVTPQINAHGHQVAVNVPTGSDNYRNFAVDRRSVVDSTHTGSLDDPTWTLSFVL